ncbi:MAG TPA: UDP-N-acetylmuramoyl-L-alanine--D-glutamate ligase [Bryobacteraceae bacterium]|nr:UDP-N-acetylmuramoyl-L-alanine--D-glutamate ligase [Bryobacteraceae bacterium]
MQLQGRKAVVCGLAQSGLAAIELLVRQGAEAVACDAKPLGQLPEAAALIDRLCVEFRLQGEGVLDGADLVILSPGVRPDQPLFVEARERGAELIGDVELACRFLRGPIMGITGANGKTTVTSLAGHLLRECGIPVQVGGNIGTQAVSAMVETSRDGQWNVLELSSFQTEMFRQARVHIGVALNVTPDHLDRHHTLEEYAGAKLNMFAGQRPEDFAVLNAGDLITRSWVEAVRGQVHWFNGGGRVERGYWLNGSMLMAGDEEWMPASEISLRGHHNLENVLAAGCACELAGADRHGMRRAVANFPGVEHRIEFVRTRRGVDYFNDSKATNVDATIKALESFDSGLWVILGGKDKDSDYRPLRQLLTSRARAALLIGAAAQKITSHIEGSVHIEQCGDLSSAIDYAQARAVPGDTVLLAPACASFDQFKSYEHRGQVFKQLVRALEE